MNRSFALPSMFKAALPLTWALAALAVCAPAHAAVFFGFGMPLYYPPPVYYPPPIYYAPPPVAYAPPAWSTPPAAPPRAISGQTCYAGQYVCPMQVPIATGGTCWCPNNTGRRAYGRAN